MPDSSDTPPPSSPEPNPPAPSLNYISPRDDPERKQREIALAVAGSVLTTIATLMVVFYWLGNNIRIHPPPAGSPSAPVSNTGPWIATFIALSFLAGAALIQYRRQHSTAFAKGILIGLGIAALIEGLCFMKMFR